MKYINLVFKAIFFAMLLICITIFTAVFILNRTVSHDYKINRGDTFKIDSTIPVTADLSDIKADDGSFADVGDVFSVDLKLFGIIPFTKASVTVVEDTYVSVLGTPFGMKVYTDGVLVIEAGEVKTETGNVNPSELAGIKVGDYIRRVNGRKITCNEDLSEIVSESAGQVLKAEILRDSKKRTVYITPVLSSEDNIYRIGIWVRDSSAGVGTLTFYSPANSIICGLGHGICDSDTGELLIPEHGELVGAEVISVKKGKSGNPGELKGRFTATGISDITLNTENGVYGRPFSDVAVGELTKIALKQEIKDGNAQILCTVNGNKPKLYSCKIRKRSAAYNSSTQNMIVTVTDKELLKITGGIIQGMSGSPVLQNGKLIGAVTHVFVDVPESGYAVYAENMFETAQSIERNAYLREAS
ncbi:MAG: SpoIVB peptidase [Clostridia bacterium]|nr:SpoIVB peptidase [Clostridia bacterium]